MMNKNLEAILSFNYRMRLKLRIITTDYAASLISIEMEKSDTMYTNQSMIMKISLYDVITSKISCIFANSNYDYYIVKIE